MAASIADRRAAFHRLHESGCFVIPNPWDIGSAQWLQATGFKALATTSSGFAWSHGHSDGAMSRDRALLTHTALHKVPSLRAHDLLIDGLLQAVHARLRHA